MLQDLKYSVRMLRQTPAFSALAVFVLGLGIGVNTAIFSLVNAVLLRPPSVAEPDHLRYVYQRAPRIAGFGYDEYRALAEANVFTALAAVSVGQAQLGQGADARVIAGESVSANYFDVLGVRLPLGRGFTSLDDEPGAPLAVVISHTFWTRELNARPDVIGTKLALTHRSIAPEDQWPTYTVVGVAPASFSGVVSPWTRTDFWVPLVQRAVDHKVWLGPGAVYGVVPRSRIAVGVAIGRVRPGGSDELIESSVAAISEGIRQAKYLNFAPEVGQWGLAVREARRVRLPFDPTGKIVPERLAAGLLLVSGVVLVIAVSNLAGMLSARAVSRRAEMAVRLALGACWWQITRRLITEGCLLSAFGALAGLAFAQLLLVFFVDQSASGFGQYQPVPTTLDMSIDMNVLAITLLLAIGVALLATLPSARQSFRTDVIGSLGANMATGTPKRERTLLRHLVLIPQVCLSAALLLVAGVLARPLLEAERVSPGYEPEGLAAVDFNLTRKPAERGMSATEDFRVRRREFHRRVLETLAAAPGVSSAALTLGLPADPMWTLKTSVTAREGFPTSPYWWVSQGFVSDDYFKTLGMRVISGRAFDGRDRADSPKVAIVDETLARWLWQGADAIGRQVAIRRAEDTRPPDWLEVVGVVNEVQPPITTGSSNPYVYVPLEQGFEQARTVLAKGPLPPGDLVRAIRQTIYDADPSATMTGSGTVDQRIAAMLYPRRLAAGILSAAGFIGLILAGAGLFGVISYSVAQRLRELGIRATLGATRRSLMGLVLREGGRVAAVGAVLGMVVAYVGIKLTSSLVVAIPQLDKVVVIAVPLILAGVVLAACFVPARRASRVDPIVVLRNL